MLRIDVVVIAVNERGGSFPQREDRRVIMVNRVAGGKSLFGIDLGIVSLGLTVNHGLGPAVNPPFAESSHCIGVRVWSRLVFR